jgi:hypothetical protein
VRERFEWAVRQGNPGWLWPDVTISDWRHALAEIERAAREILTDGVAGAPLSADPEALGVAAYTSGTGPIFGYWIEQHVLTAVPEISAVLARHLAHNRRRMGKLAGVAVEFSAALAVRGVDVTIIKGMHTALAYFPEPGTRPLSDIDMLIDPRHAETACAALQAAGFEMMHESRSVPPQQTWRLGGERPEPRTLAFVHADDPWSIDLQTSLDFRYASLGRTMRLGAVWPAGSAERWPLADSAGTVPQPLRLLHLAVHASCPISSLTLLRLIELVLVIRKDTAAGTLGWSAFLAAAERSGALAGAYPALRMCDALVPGTVPAPVLAGCERAAPPSVAQVLDRLTPATAQRVVGSSFAERFMWSTSLPATARQLVADLFPRHIPLRELWRISRARGWRLARGTLGA